MDITWKDLLSLIGVTVGWFLNQITQSLTGRRERRRALARVLADMLEIRNRLRAIPTAVKEISKRLPLGKRDQLMLGIVLNAFLPIEMLKSFDEAVNAVAAEDPLLGYRLRSQNLAPALIEQLRRLASNDAAATEIWPDCEQQVMGHLMPRLDELILKVARLHSWRTWLRVYLSQRRSMALPEGLIDGLIERALKAQTVVGFGIEKEWKAFIESHKEFMQRLPKLLALLQQVFIRTGTTDSAADRVVFFLGRLMVEDFMEIVLLCGNGYGVAALKLLRGMYERQVTASYLSKNPSEVDSFLDFHHVQEWKLYKRVAEVYKEKPMVRPEIVEKIRGAYEEVKDKFMEPVCEKCGTTRPQTSWSRLDTASMALKAGDGLDQLYLACYLFPTLQSHATVSSLFTRMKATPEGGISFDEGPQKGMVDWALVNAHGLILRVIDTQTEHFRLGLDAPLQVAIEDFKAIWKSSPDEAAKTPTD